VLHRRAQPRPVLFNQRLEPGFLDRRASLVDGVDRAMIDIDTDDLMTAAGNRCGHDRPELS